MTPERDMRPDYSSKYVLAMAHYDGEYVLLADAPEHPPACGRPRGGKRYQVGTALYMPPVACWSCGLPESHAVGGAQLFESDDRAEAEAAFTRACEELRSR